ncbi:MAG: hypothetical protein RID53_21770 [Coleofasciculus sp. B1-GNL1-01]|uniref:hypothetical protein n=1 Tax=Coleofasciculus sp. B1-GNL1-01 TaxID=3068484 RepID=UPI0032F354EB
MTNSTTNITPSNSIAVVTPAQPVLHSPASWMKDGNSPAEIILAIAILVGSLTGLVKVVLPVFLTHNKIR